MPDSDALLMLKAKENQPALSSASDMPVVTVKEPVETQESTEVDSAQAAVASTESTENSATSEESGADPAANTQAKPAKGVQKRIDELTRQRSEAERLANEQSNRLDKALEMIERLTGAPADKTQAENRQDDPRPTRQTFDDPDDYTDALAQWSGRQAVKAYQAEQQQVVDQTRQQDEIRKLQARWQEGQRKAMEKYPDFEETVQNDSIVISPHVGVAITNHPMAHDISYWLGKHPAEAERISALSPLESAMEIGAIAYQLKNAKPEVSRAPAPVKPVGSGNQAAGKTPNEESMDEYAARRNREQREARNNR